MSPHVATADAEERAAAMATLFHAHVVLEARDSLARNVAQNQGVQLVQDPDFLSRCKAAFVANRAPFTVSLLQQDV